MNFVPPHFPDGDPSQFAVAGSNLPSQVMEALQRGRPVYLCQGCTHLPIVDTPNAVQRSRAVRAPAYYIGGKCWDHHTQCFSLALHPSK